MQMILIDKVPAEHRNQDIKAATVDYVMFYMKTKSEQVTDRMREHHVFTATYYRNFLRAALMRNKPRNIAVDYVIDLTNIAIQLGYMRALSVGEVKELLDVNAHNRGTYMGLTKKALQVWENSQKSAMELFGQAHSPETPLGYWAGHPAFPDEEIGFAADGKAITGRFRKMSQAIFGMQV